MKNSLLLLLIIWLALVYGCSKASSPAPDPSIGGGGSIAAKKRPASLGIIGDTANVATTVKGGLVLMGGGRDVDAAFKWMLARSGGGDVIILRATGTDAYNTYVNALGTVNSVETLLISSRELANNDTVAHVIKNAEMVFIAGGDQSNYMNYWRGTKVEKALNYLLNEKKATIGGTSAGCAILGGFYYSGETGGLTSAQALANPYDTNVTLYNNDFLKAPYLQNTITDQHYLARQREGRSVVFLARILKDWNIAAKAIAVDERTAVCIDENGHAKVYGDYSTTSPYSYAYFLNSEAIKQPERLVPNAKVNWENNNKAVAAYEVLASIDGGGDFNVGNFSFEEVKGGLAYWWFVKDGELVKQAQ